MKRSVRASRSGYRLSWKVAFFHLSAAFFLINSCAKPLSESELKAQSAPVAIRIADFDTLFSVSSENDSNDESEVPHNLKLKILEQVQRSLELYRKSFVWHSSKNTPLVLENITVIVRDQEAVTGQFSAEGVFVEKEVELNTPVDAKRRWRTDGFRATGNNGYIPNGVHVGNRHSINSGFNLPEGFDLCGSAYGEDDDFGGHGGGHGSNDNEHGFRATGEVQVVRTKYDVSFRFRDTLGAKAPSSDSEERAVPSSSLRDEDEPAADGILIQKYLEEPLEVLEFIKIRSNAQLSINLVKRLPPWLQKVVAQFFDQINLGVSAKACWSRVSELSPDMFYKGQNGRITSFTKTLANEVISPFCQDVKALRNLSAEECAVNLPPISDPVSDLEGRYAQNAMTQPIYPIRTCEKTGMSEGFGKSIYKLFFSTKSTANILVGGQELPVFKHKQGGWEKTSQTVKVVGQLNSVDGSAKRNCIGMAPTDKCYLAQIAAYGFEESCRTFNARSYIPEFAVSDDRRSHIVE